MGCANIERKLFAMVFTCEKFHTYIYSCFFLTGLKLLKMIHLKIFVSMPHLQQMILWLQYYYLTIKYCVRLLSKSSTEEIHLAIHAGCVAFSHVKLQQLHREVEQCPMLSTTYILSRNRKPKGHTTFQELHAISGICWMDELKRAMASCSKVID